jgi:two-component system, OmpR family, response regulator
VRLPASFALSHTPEESSPPSPEPTSITPKRVLVVDDNIDAANTLEMLLRSLGHETRVVYDRPSALETLDEFRPDVVLLDIGMPGMNGFEVARHLRARKNHQVKIVAVTGWGSEADRARAAEAGFDRHLVKPVDETDLRRVLINGVTQH